MARIPTIILAPRYADIYNKECSFRRRWLSSANVENVVKPPQKPVPNKRI